MSEGEEIGAIFETARTVQRMRWEFRGARNSKREAKSIDKFGLFA